MARLAWRLGNRHLTTEIRAEALLIRDNHVVVAMLRSLGAGVGQVNAPFNPEGGAYGEQRQHSGSAHDHEH